MQNDPVEKNISMSNCDTTSRKANINEQDSLSESSFNRKHRLKYSSSKWSLCKLRYCYSESQVGGYICTKGTMRRELSIELNHIEVTSITSIQADRFPKSRALILYPFHYQIKLSELWSSNCKTNNGAKQFDYH